MISIRIITANNNSCKRNVIYVAGNRIHLCSSSNSSNIEYVLLPPIDFGTSKVLDNMMHTNPEIIFFFQENSSDDIYLTNRLSSLGVRVILLQDGYKPYPIWHKRHRLLSELQTTFIFYKQMIKRKAVIPTIIKCSFNYGHLPWIDEVWLDYPDSFRDNHKHFRKTIQTLPPMSDVFLKELEYALGYNCEPIVNSIIYIGQPVTDVCQETERIFIQNVINKFPNKQFLYKPHPNMKKKQLDGILSIDGMTLFNVAIPAEMIMLYSRNSIFMSPYSASLLTYVDSNRFYWIHKIFNGKGRLFEQLQIVNPTSHIKEILGIEEVV